MGLVFVGLLCALAVAKIKNAKARNERDRRIEIEMAGQFTCVRKIMSSLVAQVYATDGGQREHASEVWRSLGYEECDFSVTEDDIEAAGRSESPIRVMLFQRQDNSIRGTFEEWTRVRPKYVVAIRGTRPRCRQDIVDDIWHACENLHRSPAYDVLLTKTNTIIDSCVSSNGGHFNDKMVCVTGHSLGAAFGLLVARQIFLDHDDCQVQAHLFNPPFLTLEILSKKAADALGPIGDTVLKIFRLLGDLALAKITARDPGQVAQLERRMEEEYFRLRNWTPNLYVNEHDTICNHYIKYFESNTPQFSSSQARSLQVQGVDVKASHLIPSAVLHTNSRKGHPKLLSYYTSHMNNQWFKHPLEGSHSIVQYNLLAEDPALIRRTLQTDE